MSIVVQVFQLGMAVAEAVYQAGLHVEVRVCPEFRDEQIHFPLSHSENGQLAGTWEAALDAYFNEGLFDTKDRTFPGELRRVGNAREHKSLFRQAAHALMKDLELYGYEVKVLYT
jgi:hypothetical protein